MGQPKNILVTVKTLLMFVLEVFHQKMSYFLSFEIRLKIWHKKLKVIKNTLISFLFKNVVSPAPI